MNCYYKYFSHFRQGFLSVVHIEHKPGHEVGPAYNRATQD
jgi:hypothetical protein